MAITIADIYRYPVKGLNAEPLERVDLTPGAGLPHDRRFAIAHGSLQFDPKNPEWQPKTNYLMLQRDERLAQLKVRFESDSGKLAIDRNGKQVISAKVTEPLGKTLIGQFFSSFMAGSTRGAPKLVEADRDIFPDHMFSDIRSACVSIIGLASVKDLERVVRAPVHPLRFRANFYLEGSAPWSEFAWVGKTISIGKMRLKVVAPITRCAATNVDPETAERDLNLPRQLQHGFGHTNFGVYAEVLEAGTIAKGDAVIAP